MVEFGLKLEDNKVDEWSSQYIDYEKLKLVLKRAKASVEYRDEIIKRMPPGVVAEVLQERHDRMMMSSTAVSSSQGDKKVEEVTATTAATTIKLGCSTVDESSTASSRSSSSPQISSNNAIPTVTTPLLSNPSKTTSWGSNINQTVFKVTSYLGFANDRILLLQAYDDADEKLQMFEQSYEQEVSKVKEFYEEKLNETSQRMEVLIESVETSGLNLNTRHHKRSHSLIESITRKWGSIIHHHGNNLRAVREHGSDLGPTTSSSPRNTGLPDLAKIFSESMDEEDDVQKRKKKEELMRKEDSIKRALTDIYRTAKLLHNYSIMNYTGFVKLAKKFDKTFPEHRGMLKGKICDDGKQTELLAAKMEKMYSNWFCDGDVLEAQAQMLSKRGDALLMDWTQLRLGYRLGMCTILAMWVAWDSTWGQIALGQVSIGGRSAFPVFRACFGLLSWHWFWGMSVYVWTRYRINYIYLFEFDPRNVDTPMDIFNDAVDETLVFLLCMLMYYKSDAGDMPLWIPPTAYPSILILYTVKCLIFPWKMRKPLWVAIKQVIMAPFVSPTFFLTYVGDVFTSMVKVFQDLLWTVCFVASGDFLLTDPDPPHAWVDQFWYKNVAIPLVCLFPLWFRFNQCLRRYLDTGKRMPNLANSAKYALSQSVTLFGVFHPLYLMQSVRVKSFTDDHVNDSELDMIVLGSIQSNFFQYFWMGLFIASSLYSFCWDVYMDWGLGRREYGYLGPSLMFPKKSNYYLVIGLDLVLRFMWVLTLIPPQSGATFELPAYLSAISMTVELFRRTIWSFFRLEHEHRQNSGFRRVNFVPLHFNSGHKHKYHERHWVGWKVLVEIAVVTSIVIAISAFSVIVAQRATKSVQKMVINSDL